MMGRRTELSFTLMFLLIFYRSVFCDLIGDIFKNYSAFKVPLLNRTGVLNIAVRASLAKLYEINMRD